MRERDWSRTPLGCPDQWPQSLRTAISVMLNSRYPMFLAWGAELAFLYNDGYRPILGEKHEAALGRPFAEVWAEIWSDLTPLVERALAGEPTWSDDFRLFMERSGYLEETYFTFSYSPVRDETGGVGGMFCACTETTERVLGERRLRTLRDLAAEPKDARSPAETCRRSAAVLATNRLDIPFALLYRLENQGERACLAASAHIAADEACTDPAVWPWQQMAACKRPLVLTDLESSLPSMPAGPWAEPPTSAMVLPVVDRGQEDTWGILVLGINSRRAFDDDYRDFFELVASQVAASIANARAIEEERKRAEALAEIDRAKTLFFSNVSHEFRTPLTLMLGPLEETLGSGALAPHDRENLTIAHRNGLRLLKLVNSLLDFSRVEAGRAQAVYEPIDLSEATAELASSFRSACERAGLALNVDCPPLPEPVYVDREMWEKIVLNLLSNAFKFTFEGAITVRLQAEERDAVMSVRDTGTGIPEAELPHIFERFHRVEAARGRTHEGTGIGLALVRELVTLHGGTVEVASIPGKGTSFTVRLPFGAAHLDAGRIGASRTLASTATRAQTFVEEAMRWLPDAPTGKTPTVAEAAASVARRDKARGPRPHLLVADDNADMRDYLRSLLEPLYHVETVTDGAAALKAAARDRPDLMVLDVMMPQLDGFAVLRTLRADPALRDLPVILLSARAGEEAEVEGLEAGADDYLVKPFSARELLARIQAKLEMARLRQETAEAMRRSEDALHESEQRLSLALDVGGVVGAWDWNVAEDLVSTDRRLASLFGVDPEKAARGVPFSTYFAHIHPEDQSRIAAAVRRVLRTGGDFAEEYRLTQPDGEEQWVLARGRCLLDGAGKARRFPGLAVDITTAKRAEALQRMLVAELDHRVKNTLAVVQSLARQSLRGGDPAGEERFSGRLAALARAHTLLSDSRWSGASLQRLITMVVAPHEAGIGEGRVTLDGPDLWLAPKAAQALALAMHELATNAAKYGALSVAGGTIGLGWEIQDEDGGRLIMAWRETGGPPIEAPPENKGFGSTLIEQAMAYELDGQVEVEYPPSGLVANFMLPLHPLCQTPPAATDRR